MRVCQSERRAQPCAERGPDKLCGHRQGRQRRKPAGSSWRGGRRQRADPHAPLRQPHLAACPRLGDLLSHANTSGQLVTWRRAASCGRGGPCRGSRGRGAARLVGQGGAAATAARPPAQAPAGGKERQVGRTAACWQPARRATHQGSVAGRNPPCFAAAPATTAAGDALLRGWLVPSVRFALLLLCLMLCCLLMLPAAPPACSLWSLIKDMVGKDLTRVCLPVYFNEPLSALQVRIRCLAVPGVAGLLRRSGESMCMAAKRCCRSSCAGVPDRCKASTRPPSWQSLVKL